MFVCVCHVCSLPAEQSLTERDVVHHVKQYHQMLRCLPEWRIVGVIRELVERSQIYPVGVNLYRAVS